MHRTKVALLGAAIVVLFVAGFTQEQAIEAVDFNTIGLLAGMMILVYLTQQTGVYDYIAIRAGQLSKGRPLAVVLSLAVTTALLSAFLDNLTTILLIVPITFLLADALDVDPIPLIVIEVIASNIGGTATLIGDPPNIIIAGATDLSFNDFIVNLAPIAARHLRRRDRPALPLVPAPASDRGEEPPLRDGARRRRFDSGCGRAAADGAGARPHGPRLLRPPGAPHRAGHRRADRRRGRAAGHPLPLEQALSKIEWPTLFFFVALFVMVGALEETGAIGEVADAVKDVTGGDRTAELIGMLWIGGDRLGDRRQHPVHDGDDPGGQRASGRRAAMTPTGGRCRSAHASAATRR